MLLPSVMMGQTAEALAAVEDIVERRQPEALGLRIDPRLDPLREQPRFQAALQKVGLDAKGP